jgi:uncharacterized protein (TIGR02117 family)
MRTRRLLQAIPFLLILLLLGLTSFTRTPESKQEISREGIQIFVVSNGVHTDLVLPVANDQKDWRLLLPEELFNVKGKNFSSVAFGWGNKDFYINTPTWSHLSISTAIKAGLGLGNSAMHVKYMRSSPNPSEQCVAINLSKAQYSALVKYVERSFCLQRNCAVKIDHPGYGDHDLFFDARGTYTLFRTCNVWTNNALKNAGLKTAAWTPFADGLIHSLR